MSGIATKATQRFAFDAVRGGAALCVLAAHARDLLVRDAADQPSLTVAGRAFFAVTGLGHQAVLVFFVLSGALVTSSMMRMGGRKRWSLGLFARMRWVRLWLVLVPCLVVGFALDTIGTGLLGRAAGYGIPQVGHAATAPVHDIGTLIGNLVFLQTIAAPVFGSNGPLWSLANEAWYYALAGLLFSAWHSRADRLRSTLWAGAALVIASQLPASILQLAPVWGFGAAIAILEPHLPPCRRIAQRAWFGLASTAFVGCVLVARLRWGLAPLATDLLVGAAAAAVLVALSVESDTAEPRAWMLASRYLAQRSYTLYLSHCPVLALYAALVLGGERMTFGLPALGIVSGAMVVVALTTEALWWAFERHTPAVQAWVAGGCRWTPRLLGRDREFAS